MSDAPLPVTGFAPDVAMSEDGQTIVAVLTLETGGLTFEFAINEHGAHAMVSNLQQFLDMTSRGPIIGRELGRAEALKGNSAPALYSAQTASRLRVLAF
jgi:hypothetical protein